MRVANSIVVSVFRSAEIVRQMQIQYSKSYSSCSDMCKYINCSKEKECKKEKIPSWIPSTNFFDNKITYNVNKIRWSAGKRKINGNTTLVGKNELVLSILISLYQICFYGRAKRYQNLYFITEARNISLQRYASKVERIYFFFFFLFTKMHRKAISLYVATKGDWVAVGSTQRGNCLPSSKTLNCICATISLLQTPRQAIKRQCRRMNEKYYKGDERTKLIDQGGSRGQRRHAFGAKRMHTCIGAARIRIAATLRREIKRARKAEYGTLT